MYRVLLRILIFGLVLAKPASGVSTGTTAELLTERSEQSLSGHLVDVDDGWSSARLLAHFGEVGRAYQLLQNRRASDAIDTHVERFEARLLTELGFFARADSILALQTDYGDPERYYAWCIQRARLNVMAGEHERALQFTSLIDTVASSLYAPYRDFVAMEALSHLERFGEAATVGETTMASGVPVSLSPRFEQLLFDAYLSGGQLDKARRFVALLKTRRSDARTFAPILAGEVEIMLALGDTSLAVASAASMSKQKGMREFASVVADRIMGVVPPQQLSDGELLEFCGAYLSAKRLGDADRLLIELNTRKLSASDRERRRLHRGDLFYRERRYSKSHDEIADRFGNASLERRAALLRARIYRKTGQNTRAAETYVDYATRYPYASKAAEALMVASDLYLTLGNRTRAMEVLDRVVKTYPSHRYARDATLKTASYYLDRKHYSRGVEILEKALRRGRRNEEVLYRLSDAYRRMGKTQKQEKLLRELHGVDPVSFYLEPRVEPSHVQPLISSSGGVALRGDGGLLPFLRELFNRRENAYERIRAVLKPLDAKSTALRTSAVYLERGRQFLQMGFRDWAEFELSSIERRNITPRVSFELGVLYDDFAMHWKSVRAFQRPYYSLDYDERRLLDPEFRLLLYPLPYPALVLETASRYNITPHLVYAMMREESRFDRNAVSRAGAVGLMQLMPATGEEVANRLGFHGGVEQNLFAPEVNLTFGIWYASHLLQRASGNPLMMLSAYNAGFGNAKRWFGGANTAEATIAEVDDIDYGETKGYVKRIVESARVYHTFYFSANPVRDPDLQ